MVSGGKMPGDSPAEDRATRTQHEAAQPGVSVLLKAGAGSGKTHALINRFLRLCIESPPPELSAQDPRPVPVHPRSILAITFTRKAAVEIRERLLKQATALATADDASLAKRLAKLLGRDPAEPEKRRAAGLYEQILEHPQGLKIGTIHHFCQLILGRFALEAGLDPGHTVIEDTTDLVDEALDEMEKELALDEHLAQLARRLGKDPAAIRKSLLGVFNSRMRLDRWRDRVIEQKPDIFPVAAMQTDIRKILFPELGEGEEPDPAAMFADLAAALDTFAAAGMDGVLAVLGPEADDLTDSSKTKVRLAATAAAEACRAVAAVGSDPALARARGVLLTKGGGVRRFATGKKNAELKDRYQNLVLEAGREILAQVRRFELLGLYLTNAGLLQLGMKTLNIYDRLKKRDKVVDFQDLEALACRLMADPARAMSLLFRLDDSITHIMVDEFQDTNRNQFEILGPLVADFLGGGSGQTALPTVFFVGDVKQSIYGFRGAESAIFRDLITQYKQDQATDERDTRGGVRVLTLPTNFRSLPHVTDGVGTLFTTLPLLGELGVHDEQDIRQECARSEGEGVLCVMPPFPADAEVGYSGDQVAAMAAATLVRRLVDTGTVTWDQGPPVRERPLEWRDVLVLLRVRTRAGLYEDAFRRAGIPINPSGRGTLASSREVQDLLALLRWLVWPEDDIALATVLRSPLFRLTQQELQEVLARRGILDLLPGGEGYRVPRSLWRAISQDEDDPVSGRAATLLQRWRRRAGYDHCHDLVRRIYREGEMLERYRAAMGDQAVYNLVRIHDLTLGSELAATPTVRGLIQLLERADRRGGQEEGVVPETGDGGRVRFMTIHGAKGLEAPVVLLVDADADSSKESRQVILNPADSCSALLFTSTKQDRTGGALVVGAAADPVVVAARAAVIGDRIEEANLEYVAMTRARDRLYILGGDKGNAKDDYDSPLRRIRASAVAAGDDNIQLDLPAELSTDDDMMAPNDAWGESVMPEPAGSLPGLQPWTPPVLCERIRILTPSSVGADGDPAGKEASDQPAAAGETSPGPGGIRRGLQVHGWLEGAARLGHMPPGKGPQWEEASTVFCDPGLGWVFHPETEGGWGLSEAPVIAERQVSGADGVRERITGVIDRLVFRPGRIDIIDYKTNRCAAEAGHLVALADHFRPQLAMYQEVLALIHPALAIHTWLLFTDPGLAPQDRLVNLS